jgi:hypothetical protein
VRCSKGMNADNLSIAEEWSIAKRVHVGRLVESDNIGTSDSRRDQLGFKRWRASEGAELEAGLPMTAKKSGGNIKREEKRAAHLAELQQLKMEVEKNLEGVVYDKSFRNLMLCSAVHEFRARLASQTGIPRHDRTIAHEVLKTGDFDGCSPPLCARGIVDCYHKMEADPNFAPKYQGGRPTILNSPTSEAFMQFAEEEWKSKNPSGQASVTNLQEELGRLWLKFYANNDAVQAPEFSKKTLDRWSEAIKTFTCAQTGRKKNVRGAEAMDDPRNMISFAAVCYATMHGVPDELKLNYDDVSFMVAEDMGVVKICYAHKDVVKAMNELGRSMSWHYDTDGPKTQVRMFVCGFLSTGSGRLPAMVTKFYDRRLQQRERVMLHYIGKAGNGCEMYWVNIKLPAQGEASNDDEEVNRIVMRDVVAREVEINKQSFIAESCRIIAQTSPNVSSLHESAVSRSNDTEEENEFQADDDNDDDHRDHYRDDLSDDEIEVQNSKPDDANHAPAAVVSNGATASKLREINALRQTGQHHDRSVVSVDGACSQIQSLCGKPGTVNENGVIYEYISPLGNDVIKGSAACSMSQNPNDVSRCHSQLKSYVRTKMKWKTRHVRPNMQVFIENVMMPLGLDNGSMNTVLLFCGHLENMVCKVWQPATIRAGWIKAGLVVEGSGSEGGIDLKRILSHWVGLKELPQNHVQNIIALIPTLALEVVSSTTVSDASMQQFEKYFPRPFIHYKKDRADMSISRGRSCVLLANKEMHRMRWLPVLSAAPALENRISSAQSNEQPPHYHGWKDDDRSDKAERICDCKSNHCPGARFYRNNPKAWTEHQKTKAHQKWLAGDFAGDRMQTIGAAPFEPFSDHVYASAFDHYCLSAIASELSLSKAHAERFAAARIQDSDAVWLAQMTPRSMQMLLGLPHALCDQFISRLLNLGKWKYASLDDFFDNCGVSFDEDQEVSPIHADLEVENFDEKQEEE